MKKILVLVCATATLSLAAGSAMADSIKGKVGVTGKVGFQIPADSDHGPYKVDTDTGIAFGGGLIYGIDDHLAIEFDVTRSYINSNYIDFGITNVSLGAQYRFALDQPKLVPYVGGGLDVLFLDANGGATVDNTAGIHAAGGMDYFLTKHLVMTAEARILLGPDSDINGPSDKGNFDPNSFTTTFGVRYFF